MTTKFFTGGALTALAAALAFTAVPASAQDWHHGRDNNNAQTSHGNHDDRSNRDNGDRGHDTPARTSTPAATESHGQWTGRNDAQPQRTNTPAATQSNGQWTGRHVDNHVQAQTAANNPWRAWNGGARGTVTQDSRTYADRNRNTTYVDPNRNTTYRDQRHDDSHDRRDNNRNDNNRDWRDNNRNDNYRNYRDARGNYQQWDRNWRNNNRYDWQRYRTYNRYAYHLRPYYAPYRGYSYRRLGIGFYLDPLFFGQDYLIGDPGYYRLPDVYGPYRWVRYYDDALLVDIYSGQVVDVIYDFFW